MNDFIFDIAMKKEIQVYSKEEHETEKEFFERVEREKIKMNSVSYDKFNREERALCSHLFRFLHENLATHPNQSGLYKFLEVLKLKLKLDGETESKFNLEGLDFSNATILTEVALIRDAYAYSVKTSRHELFMDDLVRHVKQERNVNDCLLYSQLDEELKNPRATHPKQILYKAISKNLKLCKAENKNDTYNNANSVYGEIQGMFNAKPDLAITIGNYLIVIEAKLTEKFDEKQLVRTKRISQVWSKLLYHNLGFSSPPLCAVAKLGRIPKEIADIVQIVDISWEEIFLLIQREKFYTENDRTYIAFKNAINLLENK